VKTFSAKHVQPVAGIDPVQLAENVYTSRTQQAVAKLGEVKSQLDELQVAVQQYVAAQSKRVQDTARTQVDHARNLAAVSVNKAKSTLPQNLQVRVEQLGQTITDLNIRNMSDIQNSLAQIRDLLAAAPQELQQATKPSSANTLKTPATHGKKSSIASPQAPEAGINYATGRPNMWASPLKPEDAKQNKTCACVASTSNHPPS